MGKYQTYSDIMFMKGPRYTLGAICIAILLGGSEPLARVINVEKEVSGGRETISKIPMTGAAALGGVTGNTIRIAIVDSGIDIGHDELSNRISHVTVVDPRNEAGRDHATLLAGIVVQSTAGTRSTARVDIPGRDRHQAVAGNHTHSVAPYVDLVDIRASFQGANNATLFEPTAVAVGIASAAGGYALHDGAVTHILDPDAEADIINISIGGGSVENTALIRKAMQLAADADKILVIAAGNAGRAEPDYPARVILDPQIAGLGVVVVNMMQDEEGEWVLNGQSNRCGATAEYCVGAPGTDIEALLAGGRRGQATGSSVAAAHVSAALARIKTDFPQMSNREVVTYLLEQSGLSGRSINAVTGRGMIDADTSSGSVSQP